MRFLCGTLILAGLLACAVHADGTVTSEIYYSANDAFIVDMESLPTVGAWERGSRTDGNWQGWGGTGYQWYTGGFDGYGPAVDIIEIRFMVKNPGTYKFAIRGLKDGSKWDKGNDCYTKWVTATGEETKFVKTRSSGGPSGASQPNGAHWDWKSETLDGRDGRTQDFKAVLPAGVNKLAVAGRSKNFYIDRIAIWKGSTYSIAYARNGNPAPENSLNRVVDKEAGIDWGATLPESSNAEVHVLKRAARTPIHRRWQGVGENERLFSIQGAVVSSTNHTANQVYLRVVDRNVSQRVISPSP